ncbi:trichothecene 3-O-acetyltransferase [Colletotrichum orchidophilum]|uniref:Trichothecene 3-O-acetyltransferase n=1 Tax=Colletotrichum orchidophilum TaxID=1209926 RepID=A0A1G4AM80_9PEZI|nr:trichothecene 3-O-acetyltransferase [Colletotrichum orchidophilum]OHE90216.1 trichothecene 3-O-acetyltransferase [Colletotrichum orchidophilum]
MLADIARVRDKLTLYVGSDVFPPTTLLFTDWRDVDPYAAEFGFGSPTGFRCPWDSVTGGLVVIYLPRPCGVSGDDEGNEISLAIEKELVWDFLADPEWNRVFEFQGVEVEDVGVAAEPHEGDG